MKTYNDFINLQELFDSPTTDIDIRRNDSDFFRARFSVDVSDVSSERLLQEFEMYMKPMTGKDYSDYMEIMFERLDVSQDEAEGITGASQGVVFTIFSTVAHLIKVYHRKHFLSNKPRMGYAFSAKEPSRVKLYHAFAKKMVKDIPELESYDTETSNRFGVMFYLEPAQQRLRIG